MRYHIDTIPVWDAVKLEGECPLCALRRKVEKTDVERYLGGSVMEPDTRIRVNEKGFCQRHHKMLSEQKNKLGHALMCHTHLKTTMQKAHGAFDRAQIAAKEESTAPLMKRMMGKTGSREEILKAAKMLREITDSCILCDSIDENMQRYAYTLLHLYQNDASFRRAFAASKGLCLKDMALLMEMAAHEMSGKMLDEFIRDLCSATEKSLEKTEGDLEWFTLKFDYRNADKPWGDSKDALERAVTKLRGWCIGEEPDGQ